MVNFVSDVVHQPASALLHWNNASHPPLEGRQFAHASGPKEPMATRRRFVFLAAAA